MSFVCARSEIACAVRSFASPRRRRSWKVGKGNFGTLELPLSLYSFYSFFSVEGTCSYLQLNRVLWGLSLRLRSWLSKEAGEQEMSAAFSPTCYFVARGEAFNKSHISSQCWVKPWPTTQQLHVDVWQWLMTYNLLGASCGWGASMKWKHVSGGVEVQSGTSKQSSYLELILLSHHPGTAWYRTKLRVGRDHGTSNIKSQFHN